MTAPQATYLRGLALQVFADRPKMSVAEWCVANLQFDEPDNRGPYTLTGREYIREALNTWADPLITDLVLVFGSQSGKTGLIMGGAAWTVANEPSRLFWVMPTMPTVRNFSRTRWQPMLRRSEALQCLLPAGRRRHDFSTFTQQVGNSIIDFVWSNSPAALSSVPARIVILDEVDKFYAGGGQEADAVSLAEQRTKKFSNPKRIKTSTPTLIDGLSWQEFLKTDQRRRRLPCPHCGKGVFLAWSKAFTTFTLTGSEAFVRWDAEAKRPDATWDLDRVERSARFECPHCGQSILDSHKAIMDRAGEWVPTAAAARGYRGYHLSSLYAASAETAVGRLAVKFLQAKTSLLGLQGFINGDLAEPWESQDTRSERTEIIVGPDAPEIADAVIILTADYQLTSPHVWYVARAWRGNSRLIAQGWLDTLDDLHRKQLELGVADNHVGIDSGYAAEEVYDYCLRWGRLVPRPPVKPIWVGWTPMKGFPRRDEWRDPKTRQPRPYDLGSAALPHQKFRLPLLEFSMGHVADMLKRLREGRTKFKWEVTGAADDTYWRHMDSEVKSPHYSPRTKRIIPEWHRRSKHWPNHLLDAEREQIVMALLHHLLPWSEPEPPAKK